MVISRHLLLYLGGRGVAAACNLFAVAVFTRLAGAETYGAYVMMVAIAGVINGFTVQGICYAFFNHYRADDSRLLPSYLVLTAASLVVVGPVTAAVVWTYTGHTLAIGALLIASGTIVFDVTTGFARTRLDANRTVTAMVVRAFAILALGSFALVATLDPIVLAVAIGGANLIAALPAAVSLIGSVDGRPSWEATKRLLSFGWPLVASFGLNAIAIGIDRFVLASVEGTATVAVYGALSDFVRACFTVFGEGIALATVAIAKRQFSDGDTNEATETLAITYRLFLLLGVFGVSFFVMFGERLLVIVFPKTFIPASEILLLIVVASAFFVVARDRYFAQVIYFGNPSYFELVSVVLMLVVNGTACVLLVPAFGIVGAAMGFLLGEIASAGFFVVVARRTATLPMPLRPTIQMAGVVVVLLLLHAALELAHVGTAMTVAVEATIFAVLLGVSIPLLGLHALAPARLRSAFAFRKLLGSGQERRSDGR
ncbi:oligosaccharide flippase family protein [Xanthobacteraceae bacterium Astr-EGSB]|uniref:lipopolysaccharide biosynthesis protein n=1 Tax=Astrobacterium formosum TaxID=3069710 RepID=UPI0027AF29BB|nr:oligosaccharide flippase family protein [Xanthobacteraceae bacterium Astr-EGSB]